MEIVAKAGIGAASLFFGLGSRCVEVCAADLDGCGQVGVIEGRVDIHGCHAVGGKRDTPSEVPGAVIRTGRNSES